MLGDEIQEALEEQEKNKLKKIKHEKEKNKNKYKKENNNISYPKQNELQENMKMPDDTIPGDSEEINTNEINTNKDNSDENDLIKNYNHDINDTLEEFQGKGRRTTVKMSFYYMKEKHKNGIRRRSAVQAMKNNKNLNDIISGIDELANEKNIPLIDRKNLVFTVKRKQLDKLKTKCNDDFEVKYKFQLL